ncbi:hypothetical protein F8M41_015489 [Gigaspora margarita]|uniref:Uncharacterized protein n=1 Tax=Gigaspora margarita TaxID=4874 RepID=A0A8H3WUM4_GIGMA|nr:hypothetical protein F8M41_015489 [Gigaspora margarita]
MVLYAKVQDDIGIGQIITHTRKIRNIVRKTSARKIKFRTINQANGIMLKIKTKHEKRECANEFKLDDFIDICSGFFGPIIERNIVTLLFISPTSLVPM